MSDVRVAFYGDDFTGSVDVLLQFARRGQRARLFVGRPSPEALADAARTNDAVGIAGIARSLATAEIADEVGPAFDLLLTLAPQVLQYKACSTADSSPEIGSIGRVLEIARDRVPGPAPILFAQPDFGRYTAFGHHFAAEQGTVYRLDRQPTMSQHPSTPMRESDLARHLSEQTDLAIDSIPFTAYDSQAEPHRRAADGDETSPVGRVSAGASLAERLQSADAAGVVLDALDDDHLCVIGEAVTSLGRTVFAIGSGGLSHAIAIAHPRQADPIPVRGRETGPVLAVSGSRSAQTRRQADAARAAGWLVRPLSLGADAHLDDVLEALGAGRSVVLTSDDADASLLPADQLLPAISAACARAVDVALRAGATRRIIVCGGDTSSRVATQLGVASLSIAANPWDNVVLLTAHAADPAIDGAELLLKGGQVGDDDLFEAVRDN